MMNKIDKALTYYMFQSNKLLKEVNSAKDLTTDQIINYGEKLSVLEFKITALEVAKES